MSRPWVDFINIDDQPLQSCSNEYGTYNFREFANGTTKNEGRHSPVVAPGRSIMLELDGNTTILRHEAPVMIRAFVFEGSITLMVKRIKNAPT